ncbi:MAG: FtsX-like permease family protein [Methylococcaceae bacterium]
MKATALLAWRLLLRDTRYGELSILCFALIIAVSCSTAVNLFSDRMQRTMNAQAAEFLAADLVISSSDDISQSWLEEAEKLQLKQAKTIEFPSALMENDELLLGSVKAVSSLYPLRGQLKISDGSENEITISQAPAEGEVWVEKRILPALKLNLGDELNIGEKALKISKILTYEPDRQGDFYSMSARVMMNERDLAQANVIQAGSRLHYSFQFSGDEKALKTFHDFVTPQLNASQRLIDIHQNRPEIGEALRRAESYLCLLSILVVLISGVAIAIATRRYTERHFNTVAVLRCLGYRQNQVMTLFVLQFLILGLFTSALGCGIGVIAQQGLFYLLKSFLPVTIATPSIFSLLLGFLMGLTILFGFALPPLLQMRKVSILRVFQHQLETATPSAWLVYGIALSLTSFFVWSYTDNLKMTAIIIGGGLVTLLIFSLLLTHFLRYTKRLLPKISLNWRFGVEALLRNPKISTVQILAFSVTLVAMILSYSVRTDLLKDWQLQLPANAPNHFAINIFPEQFEKISSEFKQQNIHSSGIYPVISGRLIAINDVAVQKIVSKETQGDRAIRRDLSLTWSKTLLEDNQIIAGEWWSETPVKNQVSIEEKLAKSLGVKLGDKLTFMISNQQVIADVTSIRRLRWDTMKPNFYMIFSPTTLDNYPQTFLTSFFLPKEQKNILNQLVKTYPNVTVLEVDFVLTQLKTIFTQLTSAINYILYFALFSGLTVLFAVIHASLDERIYESALMRVLGANRALLRRTHLLEFALLGFLAGLLATLISQVFLFALYHFALNLTYAPNLALCILIPFGSAFLVSLAGFSCVINVANKPLIKILKEK